MGVLGRSWFGLGTSGGHRGISLLHIVIATLPFTCSLLIFIAYTFCISLLLVFIAYLYCTFLLHICIASLYCISLWPCGSSKHIYIAYLCGRVAVCGCLSLGSIFGRLRVFFSDFWFFWGGLGGVLGSLLEVLEVLGRSWAILGRSWLV